MTTNADPTLTVIVGATANFVASELSKPLFIAMRQSYIAHTPQYNYLFSASDSNSNSNSVSDEAWLQSDNPFSLLWTPLWQPTNMQLIDTESRLSTKCAMTSGCVSYQKLGSSGNGKSDQSVEFRFIQTNNKGQIETVEATVDALRMCSVVHTNIDASDTNIMSALSPHLDYDVLSARKNELLDLHSQSNWVDSNNLIICQLDVGHSAHY